MEGDFKLKKKLGMLAMVGTIVLALVGCGVNNNNNSSTGSANTGANESNKASQEPKYKIAIAQYVEHPSLDATREGFIAALKDAGIVEGENLKIDYNNAQADATNNLSIAQKIASDTNDLVLAIATPTSQAVVKEVKNAPVLFAAVTDPLDAKLITNLDQPGGNVSGASDTNPEAVKMLMDVIASNVPNVKSVGIVINEGEPNAVIMAKIAEEALATHDIKLVRAAVTNTSEVKQAAESLIGRADAIFITLDNSVVEGVNAIIQVANEKKIPFFSSDRDTVEKGAIATYGFKYYDHGYQVGQMAVEVLKNGKKVGDLKVTVPEKLDLIINLKAAQDKGFEVTDAMKELVKDKDNNIIE